MLKCLSPLGKSSASLGTGVGKHLVTSGVAWCPGVGVGGELKNWMPRHSKNKKSCVRVELRDGGDPHKSEKPGWSASDTG